MVRGLRRAACDRVGLAFTGHVLIERRCSLCEFVLVFHLTSDADVSEGVRVSNRYSMP